MKITVNPKTNLAKFVGKPCPCRVDKTSKANVCPCDDFRFNQNCICNLFLVEKEEA